MTSNFRECTRMLDTRDSGFDMKLQQMRCKLAYVLRKYSADQPRVPAGSPEGGQWTSGRAGGGGTDASDGSSEASDEEPSSYDSDGLAADPRVLIAQGNRSYDVDLNEQGRL